MRPSRTLAATCAVLFLCAGCSSAGSEHGSRDAFRVALLTPGSIADQSWNAGAYQGLLQLRDSLGAEISHIQTKTPAEFEENFRHYGEQGFTAVIGHGFEFQDAAVRVAPQYPKTFFLTTSGTVTGPNLAGIRFAFEEPSYIAGVLAAHMTSSGVLGVIGGSEFPPVVSSFDAFTAGARSVDPKVTVLTSFIGNWDDPGAGREQALAQISKRADVIFQNADAAGLGVFQAARESGQAYVFGSNADQNAVAPEVTLGSVLIDLPLALLSVGRQVKSGRFDGRVIAFGAASRVVRLVLNPLLEARIPPGARAAVDSVTRALESGSLMIPVPSRDSTTH